MLTTATINAQLFAVHLSGLNTSLMIRPIYVLLSVLLPSTWFHKLSLAQITLGEVFYLIISSTDTFWPGISLMRTFPNILQMAFLMFLT